MLLDAQQLGAEALLEAINALTDLSPAGEDVRTTLNAWDLEMAIDSAGAATYNAVREQLALGICATAPLRELGDDTA